MMISGPEGSLGRGGECKHLRRTGACLAASLTRQAVIGPKTSGGGPRIVKLHRLNAGVQELMKKQGGIILGIGGDNSPVSCMLSRFGCTRRQF